MAPSARALYGAGLLRLCAGSLYARILAEHETSTAKEAVLALGRAVAADAKNHRAFPVEYPARNVGENRAVKRGRIAFSVPPRAEFASLHRQ